MSVFIIDCGAGNLHSVRKALAHHAGENVHITCDAADLKRASHIVLPGVGAFADCMGGLNRLPGMRDALEREVLQGSTPFLGICVGLQMLFARSHEHGTHEGLGWLEGEVTALTPTDPRLPVPHMGWNALQLRTPEHPLLHGIAQGAHAYFVHSFHAVSVSEDTVIASVDYGGQVVAMVARKNIAATQFHPEKSQAIGLQVLQNFLQQKREQ